MSEHLVAQHYLIELGFNKMLHFSDVTKNQGGKPLYANASFQANPGEKIGLVGPNGAGKTTVFRILTGKENVESGQISMPSKTVIGYFSQDVGEMHGRSVLAEVLAGAGKISVLASEIESMEKQLSEPMDDDAMTTLLERYGDAQAEYEARGGYDLDVRAKEVLTGLGILPEDHERPVESFSGGWKMRIALARILVLNPDLLLMDEPTNHLDLESIIWLEGWLQSFKGTLIMTSHDREFMNRVVKKIVEIANRSMTVYSGDYEFYLREREIRKEQLIATAKRQQDMLAKEEEFIARFAARASHAAQVQSRVKKLEKIDRIEAPEETKLVKFEFRPPPRSGEEVVQMRGLGKTWTHPDGRKKHVLSGVTGVIRRLNKIAVVGINGAGKSTFLKMLAEQTDPTEGACVIGASVTAGYFSQHAMDVLDPKKTIFEQVSAVLPNASIGSIRTLLGCFLFSDDDAYKKIEVLSGGEKSRVVLATILARPVNFIILDEPTNHLDLQSREVLLEALRQFEGTVVLVSHDRHFLKAVSNRVFKIGNGQLQAFEGGYSEYVNSSQYDSSAH